MAILRLLGFWKKEFKEVLQGKRKGPYFVVYRNIDLLKK